MVFISYSIAALYALMPESDPNPPKLKPGRNPRDPQLNKGKGQYAAEQDLWNFDEPYEANAEIVELKREPEVVKLVVKKQVEEPKPEINVLANDEIATESAKRSQPSSAKTIRVGLTEDEVWADFSDDPEAVVADKIDVISTTAAAETKIPAVTKAKLDTSTMPVTVSETEKVATVPPTAVAPIERPDEEKNLQQEIEDSAKVVEQEQTPVANPAATASVQITKFSRLEIITSLCFLLLLVIGGFVAMHIFKKNVQGTTDPYALPLLPVEGSIVRVKDANTYWRVPIKEGANRDLTKLDVILIPCIDLTIAQGIASDGALRVMFLNEKGEIIGDTITRAFHDDKFIDGQSATYSFCSTAGFTDFGEQEAYRARIGKPWTIKVYEGPSISAPSDSFKLLFTTPIAIDRR